MSDKARGWCFTINNYTSDEFEKLGTIDCRYIVYGREIGAGGTNHLQGYVELKERLRLSAVKSHICARAHIEPRRGTPQEASDYCKKDGDFFERGELLQQGRRSDLEDVAKAVLSKSFKPQDFPVCYIKFSKGIDALTCSLLTDRIDPPKVFWRWGLAGVGKTRYVFDTHGTDNIYVKDSSMWWNGYTQQQVILIDDFCGKWPFRDLLRLLDRYPYQGQYKGGYVKINSPYIYITCEFPPSHFWQGNELAQVVRRLTFVNQVSVSITANLWASPPVALFDKRTVKTSGPEVTGNTIPSQENDDLYDILLGLL